MKSFSVAAHGKKALDIHAQGSKHLDRLPPSSQSALNFKAKTTILQWL